MKWHSIVKTPQWVETAQTRLLAKVSCSYCHLRRPTCCRQQRGCQREERVYSPRKINTLLKSVLSPHLTVANINTIEKDGKQNDTTGARQQCSSASLPLTGRFSRSDLCLPPRVSAFRPENVTSDPATPPPVCRGVVPGPLQGHWSRRRAGRLAARSGSGAPECLSDNPTVWEELPRRRDQVRYERFGPFFLLFFNSLLIFFHLISPAEQCYTVLSTKV